MERRFYTTNMQEVDTTTQNLSSVYTDSHSNQSHKRKHTFAWRCLYSHTQGDTACQYWSKWQCCDLAVSRQRIHQRALTNRGICGLAIHTAAWHNRRRLHILSFRQDSELTHNHKHILTHSAPRHLFRCHQTDFKTISRTPTEMIKLSMQKYVINAKIYV